MGRLPRVAKAFAQSRVDLRLTDYERKAVGSTVRDLAAADVLPDAGDIEALLPRYGAELVEHLDSRRVLSAWVRRVSGHRLWVWYLPRIDVELLIVTRVPPVPIR